MNYLKAAGILKRGGIGVLPTDTIYGIAGRALSKKAVGRIYKVKKRRTNKPFIILISRPEDIKLFGIKTDSNSKKIFKKFWPGKVSLILPSYLKKFEYLRAGGKSLAFRFPKKIRLIKLLKKTGPLVCPSANPEGLSPATNIKEAREYFEDQADFYISGGTLKGKPSKLIKIMSKGVEIVRN